MAGTGGASSPRNKAFSLLPLLLLGVSVSGITAQDVKTQTVEISNSLEQARDEIVMVTVERPEVTVLDANFACVESQISPELNHQNKSQLFSGRHRLYWRASVPGMGFGTYYIANGYMGCEKAKAATLHISSPDIVPCPSPYVCSKVEGHIIDIQNQHQILTFGTSTAMLERIRYVNGSDHIFVEQIDMYSSTGTEAFPYSFKPKRNIS